jgi:hypothetical protein
VHLSRSAQPVIEKFQQHIKSSRRWPSWRFVVHIGLNRR